MNTTRRRILTYGLGGAALLTLGAALRWVRGGYAVVDGDRPVALSVKEYAVVRAIVEALFPADGAFPSGISIGVHRRIDEEVFSQRPTIASDMKLAIEVLEHAPPLVGVMGRFSSLEPQARARAYRKLKEEGPGVLVYAASSIQQMASLFYYAHPSVWGAIGYDGPWQKDAKPPDSAASYERARAAVPT